MHAVKLRPEELVGGPVRSDWLLLCRLRPRGLPKDGDADGGDTVQQEEKHERTEGSSTHTYVLQQKILLHKL